MSGRICLAATPIGNLGDGSARLWEALAEADVVAAEDTRVTKDLASAGGVRIRGDLVAMHDHNEGEVAARLVKRALAGEYVLVVSDAGMPLVSDPGYRLVGAAVEAGVEVSVIPGPSAALAALAVSGLATDRFSFEGFVPRKGGERGAFLERLTTHERTMIFFESPHRIAPTLEAMAEAFGADRLASVSRELTKRYEHTERGGLGALASWATAESPRGEMVIVVAGAAPEAPSASSLVPEALTRIAAGERAKDVVSHLSDTFQVPQRELYAAVVAARSGGE